MGKDFEELKGKRLLVLGGSLWNHAIKSVCDQYGIYIIAAGNDPSAGICDIASEYYNINSTDSNAMEALIKDKKIDGIYMGGNEPVIAVACQYINRLGFPCYCNQLQWNALQNKRQFKELCKQFGLPVAKEYRLEDVGLDDFPVITKPADGSGSNGFSVCYNDTELQHGYAAAKKVSSTGSVIIEQFVPNDGVVVFYTVSQGKILFSTLEDKYPTFFKQYGTYVGGLFDFESKLTNEFRNKYEDKIQKIINHLDIREGNFWIEVFYNDKCFYFNEVGFRYGGSGSLYPIDYFRGINQVATDIYYSLTGKSRIQGFIPLYGEDAPRKKRYAIYPVFVTGGEISCIEGVNDLIKTPEILNVLTMKKAGNVVKSNGSFGQVVLLIHFIYDDLDELKELLLRIHETIRIYDRNNRNMVLQLLNIEELDANWRG